MKEVCERHGGRVRELIGDAVMAVFGIPTVHEDDALRAVRAAVEMRARLESLNDEFQCDFGLRLRSRTGVNTGEVVVRDPDPHGAVALGDAVNVAARLEQAAQPGEILLGEATYRLVRDAVQVKPVEPFSLKGKSERVSAFRLLEVLPRVPGFERHLDAPLVGREEELAQLRQAVARASREHTPYLFTVLGTAGIGKTRLVQEFELSVAEEATVLTGRCLPYGEGITFWPLREIVGQIAGEEARRGILDLLRANADAGLIADRISGALGIAEAPGGDVREIFWAFRKLFEELARRRPLVLVFEDLHWAEPTLLDFVEHVADVAHDAPILVLALARPDLLEARPVWGGGKLNATTIQLGPLGELESEHLIDGLISGITLRPDTRARVREAAEGNPLFLEQMIAMLAGDGALESGVPLPPTIQALLAARLDRLGPDERAVIERASVVGKEFSESAVAALSPEEERASIAGQLEALVRNQLVRPWRSDLLGEEAFRFRHVLIQNAAYRAIPKALRAELHERFADWLEQGFAERLVEYEEVLGYHLEQGYACLAELGLSDDRTRRLAARAAERLAAAGRRASDRGDGAAAVSLLTRAASLMPEDDPKRLELLLDLAEDLIETGKLGRAGVVLADAVEGAATDTGLEVRSRIHRLHLQELTDPEGRSEDIRRELERAIPVLEQLGDNRMLAKAWRLASWIPLIACHGAEMEAALERALSYARLAADTRERAEILFLLTIATMHGPTPAAEGITRLESILAEATREPRVEATALTGLGVLHALSGRFDEARELSGRGLTIYLEFGMRVSLAFTSMSRGWIELVADEPAAAERELRGGYEIFLEIEEKGFRSTVSAFLAQALCAEGLYEEAEEFALISKETGASDDIINQVMWRGAQAKVLARRGSLAEAEAVAREGTAFAATIDFLDTRAGALMDLADVLRMADRVNESASAVAEAVKLYEQKGNIVSAAKARAVLGELQ